MPSSGVQENRKGGDRYLDIVMVVTVTYMIVFFKDVCAPVSSTCGDIASSGKRDFADVTEGLGPETEISSSLVIWALKTEGLFSL